MTLLEFIASIVASLAWPGVLVTTILILKEPLKKALSRLLKLKYKDLEAEFDKGLDKIEKEVKEAGLEITAHNHVVDDFEDNLRQIAEISPNAAIVEAFRQIEKAAKKLLQVKDVKADYKVAAPYRLIERILEQSSTLQKREIKIFGDLRKLRNKVTHSNFTANASQATEYIELTGFLVAKIEAAIAETSPHPK